MLRILAGIALLLVSASLSAAKLTYDLTAEDLGGGCYAVIGTLDYFKTANGGNISNSGFVVTDDGVVVIDTGSSKRYGEELRQLIGKIAPGMPINRVYNTHLHPDHYLGNQAFSDVPIMAARKTIDGIAADGEGFTLNLYRLVGDWMRGTESIAPTQAVGPGRESVGGHDIEIQVFSGHTAADLMVVDHTCGAIYAGDLVFNARTLATPHADFDLWRQSLDQLLQLPRLTLVPGHGAVTTEITAITQTRDYLTWLQATLLQAYDEGLDITEAMQLPIPEPFSGFSLARDEFQRSVSNLFPAIEAANLPVVNQ